MALWPSVSSWRCSPAIYPAFSALRSRFSLIAANDLKWLNPIIITGIAFNLACNLLFAGSGPEGLTVIGTVISLTNWLTLGLLVACDVALEADSERRAGPEGGAGRAKCARARDSGRRDLLHRDIAVHRLEPADGLLRQGRARRTWHRAAVAQHRVDGADRPVAGGHGTRRVPARPARTRGAEACRRRLASGRERRIRRDRRAAGCGFGQPGPARDVVAVAAAARR